MRIPLLVTLLLTATIVLAQNQKTTVTVLVTDNKQAPLKGHEVFFDNNNGQWGVRSDGKGMAKLELTTGADYRIRIKEVIDTIEYTILKIPALGPGQFFEKPFSVRIQYEPGREFTLDNVLFETGKAILKPSSFREMNEISDYMKYHEKETYEIAGHTDNVGQDADNLILSQARANAVKNYLVKKGIAAARIIAKGYGASQPVADNATEEGRQLNRRTELLITR